MGIEDAEGILVAQVFVEPNVPEHPGYANASLIAEAPELLNSLGQLTNAVCEYLGTEKEFRDEAALNAVLEKTGPVLVSASVVAAHSKDPIRCEGYHRHGGAFTLGRPIWEQCKNDAVVMLTLEQHDEKVTTMPSCEECWKEAVGNSKILVLDAAKLEKAESSKQHGNLTVPRKLWQDLLEALSERIDNAAYNAPDEYDDPEHKQNCEDADENAREVLAKAACLYREQTFTPKLKDEEALPAS